MLSKNFRFASHEFGTAWLPEKINDCFCPVLSHSVVVIKQEGFSSAVEMWVTTFMFWH